MGIRGVSLSVVALTFAVAVPARAQGGPGGPGGLAGQMAALQAQVDALQGSVSTLQANLASLQASFAKLDGNANLTSADLAGTYNVRAIDVALRALVPGTPPQNAFIEADAFSGTLQVNADGTLLFTSITCDGSRLTQAMWSLVGLNCNNGGVGPNGTWTYSQGMVHVTANNFDAQFNVALGGRVMTSAFSSFHGLDPSSDTPIIILTRVSQP